ncbi:hypothetical protein [Rossellomorea sp. NPDC077527]|uniref:hypothetical protein n=1 Tax=Rossellomorea sp. NPDC077527 TaxID=3364510 RepID=UPI0037CA8253
MYRIFLVCTYWRELKTTGKVISKTEIDITEGGEGREISYEHENFRKSVEKLKKIARDLEPKNTESNPLWDLVNEVCNEDVVPELELRMEPQLLDYDMVSEDLPERWEMPRDGKLLYSDRELQEAMKLLIYNLGVENTLNLIPRNLIDTYLQKIDE